MSVGKSFLSFYFVASLWAARVELNSTEAHKYEPCANFAAKCQGHGLCRVQMGCFPLGDCRCTKSGNAVLLCSKGQEVPLSSSCRKKMEEAAAKKRERKAADAAKAKRAAAARKRNAENKRWRQSYKWTDGAVAASRPFHYKKPGDSLNFLIIGDWGGSSDNRPTTGGQVATANGMGVAGQVFGAEFVLGLGDNFYPTGVHEHNRWRFEESYNKVYRHASLQVPWYQCAGNHDWAGKSSIELQIDYTKQSHRWVLPSAHYSFRKTLPSGKTIKFVMFDHLQVLKNKKYTPLSHQEAHRPKLQGVDWPQKFVDGGKAWEWLEQELANSKDHYLVLVDHQPVYTICSHGDSPGLRHIPELMKKYRVTAFMSGHDHCAMTIERDGQTYILQGAASQAWNQAFYWKKVEHLGGKVQYGIHRDNKRHVKGSFSSAEATDSGLTIRHHDHTGAILHVMPPLWPRM